FQAEDGIRYSSVTGVQTCALPISWRRNSRRSMSSSDVVPGSSFHRLRGYPRSRVPPRGRDVSRACIWSSGSQAHCRKTDGSFRRSEEHTSELQSHLNLVCRLLLEK